MVAGATNPAGQVGFLSLPHRDPTGWGSGGHRVAIGSLSLYQTRPDRLKPYQTKPVMVAVPLNSSPFDIALGLELTIATARNISRNTKMPVHGSGKIASCPRSILGPPVLAGLKINGTPMALISSGGLWKRLLRAMVFVK